MKKSFVAMVAGAVILAGSLLATPASADGGKGKKKPDPSEEFKKLDTNNDGKLSKEEFSKFDHARKQRGVSKKTSNSNQFNHLDANNDGFISLEEFRKAYDHKAKK